MAEVFINYRTEDGDEAAEFLASRLSDRFGEEHIFKASHSIKPGDSFPEALIGAARKSDVMLALMGPDWGAAPSLSEETDWVRMEILAAHASGSRVTPVIKGRKTDRLARGALPPELRWLAEVHSLRLDMHQSTDDVARIGDFLADVLPALKAADRTALKPDAADEERNSAGDVDGNSVQGRDISGGVRNMNVKDTNGPTILGDGNSQYNLNLIAEQLTRLTQTTKIHEPIVNLRRLRDRFVPPPHFAEARSALKEHGIVILDGPPGAGRTAAAQMLVLETWSRRGELHELDPQASDEGSPFPIDPELVASGDGVWVDLSRAGRTLWSQVQRELPELQKRVERGHARLVIIQPHDLDLRTDFLHCQKRIGSPRQDEVFGHLLRVEGLADNTTASGRGYFKNSRSMSDIRQFVDDIMAVKAQRTETGDEGELEDWIVAAEQPTSPREAPVSEALTKLTSASQRALLLSVAMLHGAHADVIEHAASALVASLPGVPDPALDRYPLGDRLREAGAEIGPGRHVRFTRTGYETAVRLFFWHHFPHLHAGLAAWVRAAIDKGSLSEDDQVEMARGFATQCLNARYQGHWTALVEHLTAQQSNHARELAAAAVLQAGLEDGENSRTFRQQIYGWSRASETSESLATVLVVACRQMIRTHPGEALVRLHHLARGHQERTDIWDALADVVHGNRPLLRLLLARLAGRPFETTRAVDARIFLHVADASWLAAAPPTGQPPIAQEDITRLLSAGWALAFTRLSRDEWVPRASDWLHHAADDDAVRHALLNVVIEGARSSTSVLPQLYGLAYRAPYRDVIAELVLDQISAVQGVELP